MKFIQECMLQTTWMRSSVCLLFFYSALAFSEECVPKANAECHGQRQSYFKIGASPGFEYNGLTVKGIESLKGIRDALRQRFKLFDNKFRGLASVHHAATVARLFKGNMLLYGPPGGAKSAVVECLFKGESSNSFRLQLHQMITESAFVGGQNFDQKTGASLVLNTHCVALGVGRGQAVKTSLREGMQTPS
ncbi:MAG: hypothetical protein KA436_08480 [Oligoflexales bacterium]|nr:hypothetical protein [Oligoflexales bacterium]